VTWIDFVFSFHRHDSKLGRFSAVFAMGFSSKPNVNGLAMEPSFPFWTGCESTRHLLQSGQLVSAIAHQDKNSAIILNFQLTGSMLILKQNFTTSWVYIED
jgi:hypothetical protein